MVKHGQDYKNKSSGTLQQRWQKSLSGQESIISDSKQVTSCTSVKVWVGGDAGFSLCGGQ